MWILGVSGGKDGVDLKMFASSSEQSIRQKMPAYLVETAVCIKIAMSLTSLVFIRKQQVLREEPKELGRGTGPGS